ncbi:MAG: LacI family DNA-binding transcriptional regulator [Eubacteriales bacterium]|nr:LacI family DNA-binding transcriptional regulator [Eubacteriales bacterium]MDD3881315.1 LacI family DNA-binding transcriptional regulator [Eubacteriales bacterium]MDD4512233.1 LacI family DNA-binding transcriptional regulator [Eubacteriales bacterium]
MAATMKDISRETGLGLATISKFYNGGNVRAKNRKLIEDAARKLSFVPNEFARSLKTKQSRTVGVVIPELGNAFITSIITIMEDQLRKMDYAVIVCDCRSDARREAEAVSFLLHKRVDGLINMPTDTTGNHLLPAIKAGVPVVLVDRLLRPIRGQVSAVVVDNADAAEQGTEFLLANGHRDIGLILGNRSIFTTERRFEGYMNALKNAGIKPRDELIRYGDYTMDGGYNAVKALMSLPARPSALFITNFEMTIGGMLALSELGIKVPEDISVIGFDKLDMFGEIFPNLTLIKQPQNAIGEQAAKLMLELLAGGGEVLPQTITLSTQLYIGSSTLPAR